MLTDSIIQIQQMTHSKTAKKRLFTQSEMYDYTVIRKIWTKKLPTDLNIFLNVCIIKAAISQANQTWTWAPF